MLGDFCFVYLSRHISDLKVRLPEGEFFAHKFVLAARSEVWRDLVSTGELGETHRGFAIHSHRIVVLYIPTPLVHRLAPPRRRRRPSPAALVVHRRAGDPYRGYRLFIHFVFDACEQRLSCAFAVAPLRTESHLLGRGAKLRPLLRRSRRDWCRGPEAALLGVDSGQLGTIGVCI